MVLSAALPLTLIWRIGTRVRHLFLDFNTTSPWPTWIAFHSHEGLTALVLGTVAAAIAVHRHERALVFFGLIGALHLLIATEYGFALWLFVRGFHHG